LTTKPTRTLTPCFLLRAPTSEASLTGSNQEYPIASLGTEAEKEGSLCLGGIRSLCGFL
jgi:hypothetical protein